MPSCAAFGCTNRPGRKKSGITFHRFPKDGKQREAWIRAVKRKNFTPSSSAVLCSEHFTEDRMDRTSLSSVRLREHAVPNIFKAFPPYLVKTHFDENQYEPQIPGKLKSIANPTIFDNGKSSASPTSKQDGKSSASPTSSHFRQDYAQTEPANISKEFELDIFKFLENYEQYPCLWDEKNPDFNKEKTVAAAEEALLQSSGLASFADLRIIMKSIHNTYNQEKWKENLFKKIGRDYSPQLCWFSDADGFLRKNCKKLSSSSSTGDTEMVDNNSNDSLVYDSNNNPRDDTTVFDETKSTTQDNNQEDFTGAAISVSCSSMQVHQRKISRIRQRKKLKKKTEKNIKSQEANKLRNLGSCDVTEKISMLGDKIKMEDDTNDSFEYDNNNKWKSDIDYIWKDKTKSAYKDNTNNTTCEDNSAVFVETSEEDDAKSTFSISNTSMSAPQKIQRKQGTKLKKNATKNKNSYNVPKRSNSENLTDEFFIFGQHITAQLSKLNLGQAIILQENIQQLITEARLRAIESSSWAENLKEVYKNLSGYLFLSDVQNLKKVTENKASQDNNKSKQNSCEDVTHEFSMFGQHVATQVSKLPLEQALILQQDIQKLITEVRLRRIIKSG